MFLEEKRTRVAAYKKNIRETVWRHFFKRTCKSCGKQMVKGEHRGFFYVEDKAVSPSAFIQKGISPCSVDAVLNQYAVQCRFCYRKGRGQTPAFYKARTMERVRGAIKELKKVGCRICGESEHIALDFHHLDPATKESSLRRLTSVKRIQIEAAKCVVLCANCHRKLHAGIITLTAEARWGVVSSDDSQNL